MHNLDDKYPALTGFEPGTSRLQARVDTNEPLGPASTLTTLKYVYINHGDQWLLFNLKSS